ncbi:unnamed protein product [marine sediment metagenome]|uniref:Uncharacterized protein n=1 Tax=marine sediment metagenome TaxID=412755 RepID=X0Z266_9ZZZZ
MNKRTYKTIKSVLRDHIKKNVNSLWTFEDDNFTCLFNEYRAVKKNRTIYTSQQLLNKLQNGDT